MREDGHSTVRRCGLPALAALAVIGMGCSSNPIVGTWSTASTEGTFTATETVDISASGSLSTTFTAVSASCSGSWNQTGYSWAATSTSITVSGTPSCTGSIACGALSLSCTAAKSLTGACTYALSDDNDTLALTACSGTATDTTFTRED